MRLVALRSPEAEFRGSDRRPVALLPVGAVEQHSSHLPLGTDAIIVETIAAAVEEQAPAQVLLLPTISVGASDHHLMMPGTASIGTRLVAETLANRCSSLARSSGVERFFILNGHGGNQPAERFALELLARSGASAVGYAVDYWSLMFDELDAAGIARPPAMGHADLFETSILLAIRPELVRMDLAETDRYQDPLPSSVFTTLGIPERTAHGGVGDPTGATAQYGWQCFDAAVRGVRAAIGAVEELPGPRLDAI